MIYIFYGPDTFRSRQALRERRQAWLKARQERPEEFVIDGRENTADIRGILHQFLSPSLFSVAKILTVKYPREGRDWEEFWLAVSDKELQDDQEKLVLVWTETISEEVLEKFPKNHLFFFKKLAGRELRDWFGAEMERASVRLDSQAEDFLLRIYGENLEGLHYELEKLANVKPGQVLGIQDITATASTPEPIVIFPLYDAVGERNRPESLRALAALLAQGESENELYAAVTSFFRNMILVKLARSEKDIAKAFAGRHPFWVSRLEAAANNFSVKELTALFRQAFQGEYKFKTGQAEAGDMLAELVLAATR